MDYLNTGGLKVRVIKKIFLVLIIGSLFVMTMGILWRTPQKPIEEGQVETAIGIPYQIATIPESNKRPGTKRRIKSIVVHNTANPNSTAQNERDYLVNPTNTSSTSFHMVVDENEIVEAIPVNEIAFHAGSTKGNKEGIGIEICESGNYEQAEENAVQMIAYLMKTYDIPLSQVKTHQDCSGKECPRLILGHWGNFIERVDKAYKALAK